MKAVIRLTAPEGFSLEGGLFTPERRELIVRPEAPRIELATSDDIRRMDNQRIMNMSPAEMRELWSRKG